MKGCYCLIIDVKTDRTIEIGKRLGSVQFNKGFYVYVGSAMNSLYARINRHLSDDKKLHWHIDYLSKNAEITDVICNISSRKIECDLSKIISLKANGIKGFGCSDCKCESHLYYFKSREEAIECVLNAYKTRDMPCEFYKKQ